ncbi:hypothetical protein AGABI2DRAFT_193255 [Agaricus bisporus var. bisporus H97]|uniref:hypothetical protein n=1 Tax=Agaricus bisporus var. bisporus (strain H97 / ATCC MYA-4626 / FGSC 10389) TaxID=936046 RepID=UPI00029F765A|nr:hypothetical protein AGABI2DRAFT_193255 [Agaricus bisporus var. bisporus H97]EKV46573.1 hypothetical protein AGABI2DRAFT_193255 [Agaricus bisporus var. bisporus H97]
MISAWATRHRWRNEFIKFIIFVNVAPIIERLVQANILQVLLWMSATERGTET